MNIQSNMCNWEMQKAGFLMTTGGKLGMDISGYGEIGVNQNSGNTFMWLEDYDFCLYMPINCELQESDIWVIWTNPEDGEEVEKTLDEFSGLDEIEQWTQELREELEESEE
jgi:hypothetical protein